MKSSLQSGMRLAVLLVVGGLAGESPRNSPPFRCIMWVRACFVALMVCDIIQIKYDLNPIQSLEYPSFGAARSVTMLLFAVIGLFVNDHPCFRWLVRMGV
jgi:hypothetical protein